MSLCPSTFTYVRVQAHILNGLYHVQASFHAAHRVIRSRLPVVALELGNTVVTIAQQLHAQTVIVLEGGNRMEKKWGEIGQ